MKTLTHMSVWYRILGTNRRRFRPVGAGRVRVPHWASLKEQDGEAPSHRMSNYRS